MYFVSIFNNWDTVFPAWHLPWNFVTTVKVYQCLVWFCRRQRLVCGFVIGLHVLPTSEASAFTTAFFFSGLFGKDDFILFIAFPKDCLEPNALSGVDFNSAEESEHISASVPIFWLSLNFALLCHFLSSFLQDPILICNSFVLLDSSSWLKFSFPLSCVFYIYSLIRSTGVFSGMAESKVDAGTVDRNIVLKSWLKCEWNVYLL